MYLKSLRLENIACFEELDLDFTDETGDPCKWVVLLGENGTGKSTICQLVGITLLHQDRVNLIASDTDWGAVMRVPNKDSRVFLEGNRDSNDELDPLVLSVKHFHGFRNHGIISVASSIGKMHLMHGGLTDKQLEGFSGQGIIPSDQWAVKGGFLSCGYGVRKNTLSKYQRPNSESYLAAFRFSSLIGDGSGTTNVNSWLSDLYFKTVHEMATPQDKKRMEIAVNAVNTVLPDVRFSHVDKDQMAHFVAPEGIVIFGQLSDGYRHATTWVVDLVRRLCEAFPDMDNPLEATGVVLVDEIDLHLHPRWQRTIVKQIRETFPNLQFIVTSHSPFVAQDMTEKDKIIVLTRDGDKVTARQEKGFVKGWRADQILTSWLFGLETSRDEEIESLEKERRVGLQRAEGGTLTDAERLELDRVTNELEAMRSSDVAPDRQKLEAAANLVMELMSKAL